MGGIVTWARGLSSLSHSTARFLQLSAFWTAVAISSSSFAQIKVVKSSQGQFRFSDGTKKFRSIGINHIQFLSDMEQKTFRRPYSEAIIKKYTGSDHWREGTYKRMSDWGFNTVGAWSDPEFSDPNFYHTPIIGCSGAWAQEPFFDVFSDQFRAQAETNAREVTARYAQTKNVIGYFLDNELHWGVDHRNHMPLMDQYLTFPSNSPGKKRLVEFLRQRYSKVSDLNWNWYSSYRSFDEILTQQKVPSLSMLSKTFHRDRSDFLLLIARTYFQTCSTAVKKYSPNTLLLGTRLVGILTFPEVLQATAETQDVISVNFYEFLSFFEKARFLVGSFTVSTSNFLEEFYKRTGKPILISEFGYRAKTSQQISTLPPIFPTFKDQWERAVKMDQYLKQALSKPYIIGLHVFQYFDQPSNGRFDGENSNWGLVSLDDHPYENVISVFQKYFR